MLVSHLIFLAPLHRCVIYHTQHSNALKKLVFRARQIIRARFQTQYREINSYRTPPNATIVTWRSPKFHPLHICHETVIHVFLIADVWRLILFYISVIMSLFHGYRPYGLSITIVTIISGCPVMVSVLGAGGPLESLECVKYRWEIRG